MSTYAGTYQYMAPGVVSNNMYNTQHYIMYTNKADIWSLGIVALYMLLGFLPNFQSEVEYQH